MSDCDNKNSCLVDCESNTDSCPIDYCDDGPGICEGVKAFLERKKLKCTVTKLEARLESIESEYNCKMQALNVANEQKLNKINQEYELKMNESDKKYRDLELEFIYVEKYLDDSKDKERQLNKALEKHKKKIEDLEKQMEYEQERYSQLYQQKSKLESELKAKDCTNSINSQHVREMEAKLKQYKDLLADEQKAVRVLKKQLQMSMKSCQKLQSAVGQVNTPCGAHNHNDGNRNGERKNSCRPESPPPPPCKFKVLTECLRDQIETLDENNGPCGNSSKDGCPCVMKEVQCLKKKMAKISDSSIKV